MVQLRGKEDLDIGQWSEWSAEVTGTPWIGTWGCMEGPWCASQRASLIWQAVLNQPPHPFI